MAFRFDWAWEEARAHLTSALEINPSLAGAHLELGRLWIAGGRSEPGRREIALALELDPRSPRLNAEAGRAMIRDRRYDAARRHCRRALELAPEREEARLCLRRVDRLTRADAEVVADLRRELDRIRRSGAVAPDHDLAVRLALLGEAEPALAHLEKARAQRHPAMVFLAVDPEFDGLRADPRFARLMAQVGLAADRREPPASPPTAGAGGD